MSRFWENLLTGYSNSLDIIPCRLSKTAWKRVLAEIDSEEQFIVDYKEDDWTAVGKDLFEALDQYKKQHVESSESLCRT